MADLAEEAPRPDRATEGLDPPACHGEVFPDAPVTLVPRAHSREQECLGGQFRNRGESRRSRPRAQPDSLLTTLASWPRCSSVRSDGRYWLVPSIPERGLYSFRDYPTSPREELNASWLRLAPGAVVSHESALELLGLSHVIPNLIHLSVPRSRRKLARRSEVALLTTTRPLDGADVVVRDGMRLTGPARTIADVAEAGLAPEQVVRATAQAIDRGLTTPSRLREAVLGRGRRVGQLVEIALAGKDT